MQVTFRDHQNDQTKRHPIAFTPDNIRGRDVLNAPEFADLLKGQFGFSISIVNGKGELTLRRIGGKWHEKVDHVDHCFGHISGKYRAIR